MTKAGSAAPAPVATPARDEHAHPSADRAPGATPSRFRHDGLFWRRLAYYGATRSPLWFRRVAPAVTGAVMFALLRDNRRTAMANLRRIHGTRGPGRDLVGALRTFVDFSYCVSEAFEFHGPDARPLIIDEPTDFDPNAVLGADQGVIVLTSHFGSWEIGARVMQQFQRPVNVVMAREANPTVENFARGLRARHGLRVLHSDSSLFSSFNMIHALRRGEVIAMQLDRSAPGQVTREVEFFGRPAPFQYGPFVLARLAGVAIWPVFVARVGARHYRFLPEKLRRIDRHASEEETLAVMTDVVRSFERTVREYPGQWFQFQPFWPDDPAR